MGDLERNAEALELLKSIDARLRNQGKWLVFVFVLVLLQVICPILIVGFIILGATIPSLL